MTKKTAKTSATETAPADGTKQSVSRCRTCNRPLSTEVGSSPFCSERCRFSDLSKWFGEEYRVAARVAPDTLSDPAADHEQFEG